MKQRSAFRLGWMLVLACPWIAACDNPDPQTLPRQIAGVEPTIDNNHLSEAIRQITHLDEFDENSVGPEILYHLNQWIEGRPASEEWKRDPLADRLPIAVRNAFALDALNSTHFTTSDLKFLQEAYWLRDLTSWISTRPGNPELEKWTQAVEPTLGAEDRSRLLKLERCFDWIVRNIQIDALLPAVVEQASADAPIVVPLPAEKVGSAAPSNNAIAVSAQGVRGPGTTLEPWQVLLYGHGDAWQRARLLILMGRQLGIEIVMLATEDPQSQGRAQPWLPAASIAGELYLFDTALGLPLPTADGSGIATLRQVMDDPTLLSRLDIDDKLKYPVGARQLGRIVAYVDGSPAALSLRMHHLESSLLGGDRVALSTNPSSVTRELKQRHGVASIQLWSVPWDAVLFQQALLAGIGPDAEQIRLAMLEQSMFQTLHPLVQGRHRQLRGMLEGGTLDAKEQREGALELYIKARIPLAFIEKLDKDPDVQRLLGLARGPFERPEDWRNRLEGAKVVSRRSLNYASYWLGLAHFDLGNYSVAANWLDQLTLAVEPDGPWVASARFNLARAQEALGEIDAARSLYLTDESPQRHGCILRARRLARGSQTNPP